MNTLRLNISEFSISDLQFPSITIIDIIDILIVAFVIYNIIVWIKETRAWSLFKGMLVVLLFSAVAVVFRLNTILFLIKNAISVGILAIIILFQPELRKALEELGKGNIVFNFIFSNRKTQENYNEADIEEIINAVQAMSDKRTGALIVIEQKVPLGDHVKTGVALDAILSTPLLINIFELNTPLHDGAVIIKDDKILAASCFLPLSENTNINLELGTRHRAAIGVSELSDAYVIVVSEETGLKSLVHKGQLYRGLSNKEIRKRLLQGVSGEAKRKDSDLEDGKA